MPLYVVATDGHALSQPRRMTEFFIGPGERIDAIAIGAAGRRISDANHFFSERGLAAAGTGAATGGHRAPAARPPNAGALRTKSCASGSPARNGSTMFALRPSRGVARWSIRAPPTARCS